MVFNATFNNISVLLLLSILLVEETGEHGTCEESINIVDSDILIMQVICGENDFIIKFLAIICTQLEISCSTVPSDSCTCFF